MSYYDNRIKKTFEDAVVVDGSSHPRIVFFSDCHRGGGTWNDSFLSNKILYQAALNYYWDRDFTYIELGDGDELWENRYPLQIEEIHGDVFRKLDSFRYADRLYMLTGNHDKENLKKTSKDGFFAPPYYEAIIIKMPHPSQNLFLLHGHQADIFNDRLWPLARWMVRYLWKPLELSGFRDPTSAAKNYKKRKKVERRLSKWATGNNKKLMAGHTHRPALPEEGAGGYFNTGSCIHPNAVTCIELDHGFISLIKWTTCVREDSSIYVCRQVISGPRPL